MPTDATILIAAGITGGAALIGGILTLVLKNKHDAKEKEKERLHARDSEFLKDKRQAGHTIIKSFSTRIEYFSFMERHYEEVLGTKDIVRLLDMTVKHFDNRMEGIIKRNEESMQPTFQSFLTYFDRTDDDFEVTNIMSEQKALTKTTKELTDRYTDLLVLLGNLQMQLRSAAHDTRERYEWVTAEIEENVQVLHQVTRELIVVTHKNMADLRKGIAYIREEIK